ncbi:MAG: M1 family metallopeptidase [Anaerolineales bacterium]|nr:M1 family metallopeptidase [Anaerolineales bacterium]
MKIPFRFNFLFLLFFLASCTLPQGQTIPPTLMLVTQASNSSPTPTPFQPVTLTPTAIESLTLIPTFTPEPPTNTPPPTFAFTSTPLPSPISPPTSSRTQYTLFALLDYYGHQLAVDETIRYTNQTGVPLNELVLAVEPNHRGGFTLENIFLDSAALNYDMNGHRLTVYLSQPLAPGSQVTLAMRFRIAIPQKVKEHPYGYDSLQTNLTDWFPLIVPYSAGWILHDDYYLGEHLVQDSADFEVNLRATEGNIAFATSGVSEPNNEWTRYRIFGARTFALSASDQFQSVNTTAGGAQIRSYYFPGYDTLGLAILNGAVRAIGLWETQFAPFPYGSLSIVQSNLNDGQEYDGLVFIATKFYDEYNDSARSNLVAIGVHEVAHQWWYGLVGNDPAMEPWLDEAMSVYSEALFYKYVYPNSYDWWWNFRVNYFGPSGYVDTTIYEAPTFRAYVNASYLNGANFVEALHIRMGDDAFFAFLRDYASRYGHGRATAYDFFAVARQNTTADISDLIRAYFRGEY